MEMKMKMVAAWIVVVAAVALTSSDLYSAEESQAECLNRCINKCNDLRGGLCSFNCAIGCHWPFAQPTGEVMVNPQGHGGPEEAAATQAAFALRKEPGAGAPDQPIPPPITAPNPNAK